MRKNQSIRHLSVTQKFQQKTGINCPFFDFLKDLSEVPKVSILKAYSVGWAASSAGAAAAALASSSACLAAAIRS